MAIEIVQPTKGYVKFDLPWEEAEVFLRIVGLANSADLNGYAPVLHQHIQELVGVFGRNTALEAREVRANIVGGQIYIDKRREDEL